MSDEESRRPSSDTGDDDEEGLNILKKTANARVLNTATGLGKRKDEKEVSIIEQMSNEAMNPAANDRGGTDASAGPVNKERSSDNGINEQDLRMREAPTAHTAANQTQQRDTNHFDDSEAASLDQGLKKFVLKGMGMFINRIQEEVRAVKENLRKLKDDLCQAKSIITTAACSLFIKQPATAPRAREMQRKNRFLLAVFSDNVM